jgi:hypothetical protein
MLRPFRLVAFLAARCRALSRARPRRDGFALAEARLPRCPSHMTTEEVEDVVRALTMVVENLEAGAAKQSMQEAFTQVRAYASATRESVSAPPHSKLPRLNPGYLCCDRVLPLPNRAVRATAAIVDAVTFTPRQSG